MACEFYEFQSGLFGGDYYCRNKQCVVSSDTYYKYCRDYNFRECPNYNRGSSSSCFITTVVCQILGKQDNDKLLENFREFRDNILQPNTKYHDILKEYDVIGPLLADCIIKDQEKEKTAIGLYENVMLPINNEINNMNYDKAVEMYYLMTLSLVNYYKLKHEYNSIKDKNYNDIEFIPSKSGHGLIKQKKFPKENK